MILRLSSEFPPRPPVPEGRGSQLFHACNVTLGVTGFVAAFVESVSLSVVVDVPLVCPCAVVAPRNRIVAMIARIEPVRLRLIVLPPIQDDGVSFVVCLNRGRLGHGRRESSRRAAATPVAAVLSFSFCTATPLRFVIYHSPFCPEARTAAASSSRCRSSQLRETGPHTVYRYTPMTHGSSLLELVQRQKG